MAKVGAQRAAELTGRSKSTIQRAMNNGKLSYEMDSNNRRVIDVSELDRAFGLKQSDGNNNTSTRSAGPSVEQELEKATAMIEMERMKMRIQMLEQQVLSAEDQVSDLKKQRDQWQKQASQVLITSEFSQKQAEDLRAEIKEREQRSRERRQQKLDQQMKAMEAQNENAKRSPLSRPSTNMSEDNFDIKNLWKRMKKKASA